MDSINSIDKIVPRNELLNVGSIDKNKSDFSQWLQNEVDVANKQINEANSNLRQYAVGETDNLHQVMMSISEAKTSFELIMQVRNRLLEGYQEIMRMQI